WPAQPAAHAYATSRAHASRCAARGHDRHERAPPAHRVSRARARTGRRAPRRRCRRGSTRAPPAARGSRWFRACSAGRTTDLAPWTAEYLVVSSSCAGLSPRLPGRVLHLVDAAPRLRAEERRNAARICCTLRSDRERVGEWIGRELGRFLRMRLPQIL